MKASSRQLWRIGLGLGIITACFLVGDWVKLRFELILPGSVLGMFLLIFLLSVRVVRLEWVDAAARLLIFVLPVCFVTLYVTAGSDKELWRRWGLVMAGTLTLSLVMLWAVAGLLAQWLFAREEKRK